VNGRDSTRGVRGAAGIRSKRGVRGAATGFRSARGQSTVEVVALLPLLLAAGIAVLSVLSAGRAEEVAGNAAEAGAVALLQGREPRAAVRAALAGWPARRAQVRVMGRRVTVRVTPAGPFGPRLRASATADAGSPR
jgi:Flp pilus assembly protein TadG